jgi:hypothetical protein
VKRHLPPEYRDDVERRQDLPSGSDSAVTLRNLAVGLACCLIIAVGVPYGSFLIRGARLGLSSSTPAAFFGLFVLLLTLQPLCAASGTAGACAVASSSPCSS